MKKFYSPFCHRTVFVLLFMLTFVKGWGQISEGFESGQSTAGYVTSATLSSGIWTGADCLLRSTTSVHGGTYSSQLRGSTGILRTPSLNTVGTVTFWCNKNAGITVSKTIGSTTTNLTPTIGTAVSSLYPYTVIVNDASSAIVISINNTSTGVGYIDDFSSTLYSTNTPSLAITGTTAHGAICVGTPATSQTYTITNSGSTAASGVTVVSNNPEFVVSGLSSTTIAANGGTATYTVTFTPTAAGARTATVTVTSTTSGSNAPTSSLTGTGTAIALGTVTTNAVGTITARSALLNGTVNTIGSCPSISERGFVYSQTSTNGDPANGGTGVTTVPVTGITATSFTNTPNTLLPSTQYTYKAYVLNGSTYTYGTPVTFTTSPALGVTGNIAHGSSCPGVSTTPITYTLTNNSVATVTGINVSSDNTEFVVGGATATSLAPGAFTTYTITFTPASSGIMSSTISIASAQPTITNTVTGTGTTPVAQAVGTTAATVITGTAATLNGNVTAVGTCPASVEKGFVYSATTTNSDPMVGGSGVTKLVVAGISSGAYSSTVNTLSISTGYSYKAYIFNGTTYTYGAVQTFTTTTPPVNDLCADAIQLSAGVSATGTTASATFSTNSFSYANSKNDVWYKFVPSCSGTHTINLTFSTPATNDLDIDVFTSATCPTGGAANFTGHGSTASEIITPSLIAGTNYYFRVIDYNLTGIPFTLTVTAPTPTAAAVTTGGVSLNTTGTTATLNASAATLGVCPTTTVKGFVISKTIDNATPVVGGANTVNEVVTPLGSSGAYSKAVMGLSVNTGYSYQAYLFDGTTYTYGGVITFTTPLVSSSTDHFRSKATGNWTNVAIWESSPSGSTGTWINATTTPGLDASSVDILTGHNVIINAADIIITNTNVYGALEATTNNFSVDGPDSIELIVKNGGSFVVNGTGYASAGNAYALVETGGKLISLSGSGSNFAQRYIESVSGLFYFGNNAICEWQNTGSNLGSGYSNYFVGYEDGDLPIFRIVNQPLGTFGSVNNNIFNAILEVNSGITWAMQGNGNKTFVGGLQGIGHLIVTYVSGSGKIQFGDLTNVPTLGNDGKLTFTFPSDKIEFANGATIPANAEVVFQSAVQNNFITRTGGDITINGIFDLTNTRITNTTVGGVIVNGTLKTANTGGLYGAGSAIVSGNLTLNDNSTIEYYATLDQIISSGPNYYNITFSGAGTKTPQNATSVNTTGTVKITGTPVVDFTNFNLASTLSNDTKLVMDGGKLIIGTGGTQPRPGGMYTITGGVIEFAGNSSIQIRTGSTPKEYLNVEVSGTNVKAGTTDMTGLTFQAGGKFIVKSTGVFKVPNPDGFTGGTSTAIKSTNTPTIVLEPLSTIDYTGAAQTITVEMPYENLAVSAVGIKSPSTNLTVNNITSVSAGTLQIHETNDDAMPNIFVSKKGVQVGSAGAVLLANNANLKQDDFGVSNFGSITVQRVAKLKFESIATRADYNYWSSPVELQKLLFNGNDLVPSFSPGTPNNRIFQYKESNDTFVGTPDATFVAGKGYAIRAENAQNGTSYIADGNPKIFEFTGKPHNGNISTEMLNWTDANHGYNLVGNPYPSVIDFNIFQAANSDLIDKTAYFWTNVVYTPIQQGSTANGYTGNNYATYNGTGGTPAGGSLLEPTKYIKTGQGFIVKSKKEGVLQFNNSMREIGVSPFFNNKIDEEKNRFWVTLYTPSNMTNTILVGYVDGATNGFEKDYDAPLLTDGSDSFYSILGSQKLAIQGKANTFNNNDNIPLGSKYYETGLHKIHLNNKEGIFQENQNIYLKDKLLNKTVNLSNGDYTFSATKGTDATRFEIVFKDNLVLGTDASSKSDFTVYRDGSDYVVQSSKILGNVEVYDAAGRLVRSLKSTQKNVRLDGATLNEGLYIIRAENSGDIRTKKILK